MTAEQKQWLDTHREYRPMFRGARRVVKAGMLHADGSFEQVVRGRRPNIKPGSFEVAVLDEVRER